MHTNDPCLVKFMLFVLFKAYSGEDTTLEGIKVMIFKLTPETLKANAAYFQVMFQSFCLLFFFLKSIKIELGRLLQC